jgi:Na+/proline symporter
MPSVAAARRSLAVHAIGTAFVCLLFFLLGSVLFAYYCQNPAGHNGPFPPLSKEDRLTMHFVRTELAYPGLIGLLLAALFTTVMGSTSSGLNALSSVVVNDWQPAGTPGVGRRRVTSALFGIVTVLTALLVPRLGEHSFHIIIRISGALFGPLLGLFLLGAGVRRANAQGAVIGLAAGVVALTIIVFLQVSFWWYGACTCLPTLLVGAISSLFFSAPSEKQVQGLVIGS